MPKVFLIGWREFRQRVRSRGFLLSSLLTPLFLLFVWGIAGRAGADSAPGLSPLAQLNEASEIREMFGYVDQAGLVQQVPAPLPPDRFRPLPDTTAADAALAAGEIEAYYVIPPDYRQTGRLRRVSPGLPAIPADARWFEWILVANLLPEADTQERARLRWPFNAATPRFVLQREDQAGSAETMMLPFVFAIAVMIPLFTGGGYLLQSLAQEKNSRVIEILLVSLRPTQLLTGKLLGLGALTLVQYLIWAALGLLVLLVSGQSTTSLLSGVNLSGRELLLVIPYALGGFTLYAALMAGIGALAPDPHNSRTWVFVLTLPMLFPIYLWVAIVSAPNGPLATGLSLFPFSAPTAMLLRLASTTVPPWQLLTSLLLLLLTAVGMIGLMSRLFRAHTLLSGEALSLRRLAAALRAPAD